MKPIIITYLLNIIDYIFTAYFIRKYGIEIEANPIGRWMFENNIAWVYKIFVVGAFMALIGYCIKKCNKGKIASYVLLGTYSALVIYHLIILLSIL